MENQIQVAQPQQVSVSNNNGVDFFNPAAFDVVQRMANLFASSALVPDMYRADKVGKEQAIANCVIALDVATRIGASPLMVCQQLVVIYGRPSWSSTFLIATVNSCGRFEPLKFKVTKKGKLGKFKYTDYVFENGRKVAKQVEFDGSQIDNLECVAYTTAKGSDEILESAPISLKMAVDEGWYTKAGSKWKTMPEQMLRYRAASFWTRVYAPDLSMGMMTKEESQDIQYVDAVEVVDHLEQEVAEKANQAEPVAFTDEVEAEAPKTQEEPAKEATKTEDEPGY